MAGLRQRLALLSVLYFCQGLPGGYLAEALPAIALAQGIDYAAIGLVGLLSLPWMLKLLWAPLVDRWGSVRFGRRKSWMVPALVGMIATTYAIGLFDPADGLTVVLALFLLLNLFAATQDIAVDGFAIAIMHGRELGPTNSAQVGGFKLGNILGGGVLLTLVAVLGWQLSFTIMTGCLLVALVATVATREPVPSEPPPPQTWAVVREAGAALVAAPAYAAFLFGSKLAETIGGVLLKAAMVRHGFGLSQIGAIDGTAGGIATIVGAVLGGMMTPRLGWARTLMIMSCVQGVGLVVAAVYQAGEVGPIGFGIVRAWEKLAGGATAVAVFTLVMKRCREEIAATEFTAAQSLYMSGGLIAGAGSLAVAKYAGIGPVMLAGGVLTIAVGVAAWYWRARIDPPRADPASGSRSA